jgi:hypothetical protein
MKRLMSIVTLGLILFVSQAMVMGCGLGAIEEVDTFCQIPSNLGKKYKNDAIVQAILKKDCAEIERLTIDPKKRLRITVKSHVDEKNHENAKVVFECDYIGLTFSTFVLDVERMLGNKKFTRKEGEELAKILQSLVKKGVSPKKSTMKCVLYFERKDTKPIRKDSLILFEARNKQFASTCEKEPCLKQLAALFK